MQRPFHASDIKHESMLNSYIRFVLLESVTNIEKKQLPVLKCQPEDFEVFFKFATDFEPENVIMFTGGAMKQFALSFQKHFIDSTVSSLETYLQLHFLYSEAVDMLFEIFPYYDNIVLKNLFKAKYSSSKKRREVFTLPGRDLAQYIWYTTFLTKKVCAEFILKSIMFFISKDDDYDNPITKKLIKHLDMVYIAYPFTSGALPPRDQIIAYCLTSGHPKFDFSKFQSDMEKADDFNSITNIIKNIRHLSAKVVKKFVNYLGCETRDITRCTFKHLMKAIFVNFETIFTKCKNTDSEEAFCCLEQLVHLSDEIRSGDLLDRANRMFVAEFIKTSQNDLTECLKDDTTNKLDALVTGLAEIISRTKLLTTFKRSLKLRSLLVETLKPFMNIIGNMKQFSKLIAFKLDNILRTDPQNVTELDNYLSLTYLYTDSSCTDLVNVYCLLMVKRFLQDKFCRSSEEHCVKKLVKSFEVKKTNYAIMIKAIWKDINLDSNFEWHIYGIKNRVRLVSKANTLDKIRQFLKATDFERISGDGLSHQYPKPIQDLMNQMQNDLSFGEDDEYAATIHWSTYYSIVHIQACFLAKQYTFICRLFVASILYLFKENQTLKFSQIVTISKFSANEVTTACDILRKYNLLICSNQEEDENTVFELNHNFSSDRDEIVMLN